MTFITLLNVSRLFVSDSVTPWTVGQPGSSVHGDFRGKNIGVGWHFLLQWVFLTQGLNPDLLHCRQILYLLSYQPWYITLIKYIFFKCNGKIQMNFSTNSIQMLQNTVCVCVCVCICVCVCMCVCLCNCMGIGQKRLFLHPLKYSHPHGQPSFQVRYDLSCLKRKIYNFLSVSLIWKLNYTQTCNSLWLCHI